MENYNAVNRKAELQRLEIECAHKKGKAEGKEEGKIEGKIEGKTEMAEKLLKENILSAENLAALSGLPLSKIKDVEAVILHAL